MGVWKVYRFKRRLAEKEVVGAFEDGAVIPLCILWENGGGGGEGAGAS